jgi:hypothetical protein
VDLLRQALHRLKLTAKLRAQLAAATPASAGPSGNPTGAAAGGGGVSAIDLAKAAKLLADVGAVEEEGDLSGLAVLDADAGLLASAGQLIRTQADVRIHCHQKPPSRCPVKFTAMTTDASIVRCLHEPPVGASILGTLSFLAQKRYGQPHPSSHAANMLRRRR